MITRAISARTGEAGFTVDGKWLPDNPARVRRHMACTAAQARMAMASAGMLDVAAAAVAASGNPAMQIAWEYGTEWQRNDPRIVALAASIGLTDAQLDDLFLSAMNY